METEQDEKETIESSAHSKKKKQLEDVTPFSNHGVCGGGKEEEGKIGNNPLTCHAYYVIRSHSYQISGALKFCLLRREKEWGGGGSEVDKQGGKASRIWLTYNVKRPLS